MEAEADRAALLQAALGPQADAHAAINHVLSKNANIAANVPPELVEKARLANTLADMSGDDEKLVSTIVQDPRIKTLRDTAFHYDPIAIAAIVSPQTDVNSRKSSPRIDTFQRDLFHAEPSAVLHRMVVDHQFKLDSDVQAGLTSFFENQPSFNIRETSVIKALEQPDALKAVPPGAIDGVTSSLKTLQLVQALSSSPATVPILHNAGIKSSLQVATMPKAKFVAGFKDLLGQAQAVQIHDHAVGTTFRNEQGLLQIFQTIKGTGLAVIDGYQGIDDRLDMFRKLASRNAVDINLEELFGGLDFCECEDCTTVTSPAAYLVDLLQYVRNNDLDASKDSSGNPVFPNTGKPDFVGTPLESLFLRRPDLQHLQLTCENTNTLIPYIDLVNEIMESFVVHLKTYSKNWTLRQQAEIDVFNVHDETSSELLAAPQHTNYAAYCILRQQVFPLGQLPYHQPIDSMRVYLDYLKTSRYEILEKFRRPLSKLTSNPPSPNDEELVLLEEEALLRSSTAEFLGIIQEEYISLVKEAFWPMQYFKITSDPTITPTEYQNRIGVRPPQEYWGYETDTLLLSDNESAAIGLRFVKKQFMPRSGMSYNNVIDLVKTKYVNPAYPVGQALALLEGIHFSYRFLQTLVDYAATDPKAKFGQLVDFLVIAQPWGDLYENAQSVDQDNAQPQTRVCIQDIRYWVYTWFDCLAKIVVLESGEGPTLPIEGDIIFQTSDNDTNPPPTVIKAATGNSGTGDLIGTLGVNGQILNSAGSIIATVAVSGQIFDTDGGLLVDKYKSGTLFVRSSPSLNARPLVLATVNLKGYLQWVRGPGEGRLVRWNAVVDTCNIENIRIMHLDGTALEIKEWDRMQRFIRLWKRLGWSIDETDSALRGLASTPSMTPKTTPGVDGNGLDPFVSLDDFKRDNCAVTSGGCSHHEKSDCGCQNVPKSACADLKPIEITPNFLKEAFYVKKLLAVTGLDVTTLLAFWAPIEISGANSLYSSLFLAHNIVGVDPVFKGDQYGNYFTTVTKISDHVPVILAALAISAVDLTAILEHSKLLKADLTLETISEIFRYVRLAQALQIKVPLLLEAIDLFGDPFFDATATFHFITVYGDMSDQGFTVIQLAYVIDGTDNSRQPVGPSKVNILTTAKALYDGLQAIVTTYPDFAPVPADPSLDLITSDTVISDASLMFDQTVVAQISGLLEGTNSYTTNAPTGLTLVLPSSLKSKIIYADTTTPPSLTHVATLTVVGILTEEEEAEATSLGTGKAWSDALARVRKQALTFFKNTLAGIFPDMAQAVKVLLAGDIAGVPATNGKPAIPSTAPGKRNYFLQYFRPFLRDNLANTLISSTLAGEAGISSSEITMTLLSSIITTSSGQKALALLKNLLQAPASLDIWNGYLIPSTSDSYVLFSVGDNMPSPITIDGVAYPFPNQQDDPNNVWYTEPLPLIGGRLYSLEAEGKVVASLQWKTARLPISPIPSTALLPDHSTQKVSEVFVKLTKAAIIINGLSLSLDEIIYLQGHGTDFGGFNLNSMTVRAWKRALAFVNFRESLQTTSSSLLDLFKWAESSSSPQTPSELASQISNSTGWDNSSQSSLLSLLGPDCLGLTDPALFKNETTLVKISELLAINSKVGVPVSSLFKWADPMAKFWPSHEISQDIRKTIRSKYTLDEYELAIKPLEDRIRRNQRDALISYLIVQDDLRKWGVVDADSLFEFFLIDVQMGSCLQTSRIKQAISSVQTFVQRCMLGLEERYGVPNNALDQTRWPQISKETLRTANVKVFLTPEDYIVSSLRDDKSPLYGAMENDIMQKNINPQGLRDSLTQYLFKMDTISNLIVEGLFQDTDQSATVYIIGKTRSYPYLFYYRTYSLTSQTWTPWDTIPIDIPTYEVEATASTAAYDGSYVLPVVWQGRFLVFFAEFRKKTTPANLAGAKLLTVDATPAAVQPNATWEIKLGWTELRNKKWMQKQVTVDSIMQTATSPDPPAIDGYRFVSQFLGNSPQTWISICVYSNSAETAIGRFEFKGAQAYLAATDSTTPKLSWKNSSGADIQTSFHYTQGSLPNTTTNTPGIPKIIYSFQLNADGTFAPQNGTYASFPLDNVSASSIHLNGVDVPFYHQFSHQLLSAINTSQDLQAMFQIYRDTSDVPNTFGSAGNGTGSDPTYNELAAPYAIYNWEVGFHAPMELADALLQNQQFDAALQMCHYVFDPNAIGVGQNRVWMWKPFTLVNAESVLETLFNGLAPNTPDTSTGQITQWRNHPFMPHVVARSRPVAYMKWTVMKYLQILIAYGDYYFRQNSLEAVPLAIQCYITASHIYGQRAQPIPKRGIVKPASYYSLRNKWDAFGNAIVQMELSFPFSNQTPHPVEFLGNDIVLANIFGFSTTKYFSIPPDPKLMALRDLIDDRLYKIRHCQDINGNAISLALWDPPIDPALLVNAVAQGLSLSSFLNDLNAPMPNYRFYYLLQKALELCSELRAMGSLFLSLKEKQDTLEMELLRAAHDSSIQNLIMEVRKLQVDEASKAIDALRTSRGAPSFRYKFFSSLAGYTAPDLVETDTTFTPIDLAITAPTADGDLVLTPTESLEMSEALNAKTGSDAIGGIETFVAQMQLLPGVSVSLEPWGIGGSLSFGPQNIAAQMTAHARAMRVDSDGHTFSSTNSSRKGQFIRQLQDRVQQANSAGYEVKNIDAQIRTQLTRISIANQEITNQQRQIDNAAEITDFLKSKYTNDDLYNWMEGQVRTLFYQMYTLAYDIAKKAETAYFFERGRQQSKVSYIQFGYWDPSHDGLISGEQLYLGLKQLETAYQLNRGYDFEVSKSISIRQLNPTALLQLRENATCQVDLPEIMFDMDFPGHYCRRIKSVSLTIPCVAGPYTSTNCTLRLLSHRYRGISTATDAKSYVEQTDNGPDGRFVTGGIPINSIAVSTGQNDSGVFDLTFKDERYIPFEGAGVISSWQLDLPPSFRQFDYSTIADVIISIKYTSLNGGDNLKTPATDAVAAYVKSVENLSKTQGLFSFFDLKAEFATEWARAASFLPTTPAAGPPVRNIVLKNLPWFLPLYTKAVDPKKVIATDLTLLTPMSLPPSAYSISTGLTSAANQVQFSTADQPIGSLNVFHQGNVNATVGDWVLTIAGGDPKLLLDRIFLVIRFTITL